MPTPFLAQYTIRSKQAYILRTNRMAEVVGGSENIAESFQTLLKLAGESGLRVRAAAGDFSLEDTLASFAAGSLDLVELFTGGGNATILFRDHETFAALNRRYTRTLLEDYPGMIPMCVGVEMGDPAQPNYDDDYKRLMKAVEREKNRMLSGGVPTAQPFAMMDRTTFQPLSRVWTQAGKEWRRTDEAFAKLNFGKQSDKTTKDNSILDSLVTEKDEESLLAIVHADGNSMGSKIKDLLGANTNYDFCVNTMRRFTEDTAKVFSEAGKAAVDAAAKEAEEKKLFDLKQENAYLVRWVVCDGDDATFICNARLAKRLTEAYLQAVDSYPGKEHYYSSCAGICVFHSHYPFSRAYALAEDACDNAKAPVRANGLEQGWIDFHYHRSGAGGDLKEIRGLHRTDRVLARPWLVCGAESVGARQIERLDGLAKLLKRFKVSRTNLKTLGAALEEDVSLGHLEWSRICYNTDGLGSAVKEEYPDEDELYRMLYDLSEVYDLWYRKEG